MKPFDLERALDGDPVVTRNGTPVTQLVLFSNVGKESLFGVVNGNVNSWLEDGRYGQFDDSDFDLFMAPKMRQGWVGLCRDSTRGTFVRSGIFPGPEAVLDEWPNCTPVRIEWEDE